METLLKVCFLHLKQFISAEELPAATHWSLRKDGADVVMSAARLQTDAQPAARTELLHLSHL